MDIAHFTDPGCPYAFSAEPHRMRLRWHYGDQLTWRTVLIGLHENGEAMASKGLTTAFLERGMRTLQQQHGMPIDPSERPRTFGTVDACRAIAAVRRYRPELEDRFLRRLRVRSMRAELLDEAATIDGAASDIGLDPVALRDWSAEPETEELLRADMRAARTPSAAARQLDHKLAASEDGGRRYSAPSYEFGVTNAPTAVPGFQPWETYETIVANLDPTLERRPAADGVDEVLAWAGAPLATAEVAAVRGVDIETARAELTAAGATFEAVGGDGYWTAGS